MLFIRADANAEIGTGHLMRSLALAQNWQSQGGKVTFVTNCESTSLRDRLRAEGFAVVKIENSYPHESDCRTTRRILKKYPNQWCVIDGYHFDALFQRKIREDGNHVLVLDDTVNREFYDSDVILNQNIFAERLKYNCPPETVLLLGSRYAMLRREFLKKQNFQREIAPLAHRILITMGGGDFFNQTLKAVRAAEQLEIEHLEIKAVVGASNPHLTTLESAVENSRLKIELIRNAEDMSKLMAWADLAISAAGSTCWEMAFMQLPCILIVTAENQNGIATGLDEAGFAENLGWFEQVSERFLTKQLGRILSDAVRREEMSRRGREIVDGHGAERVIEILSNFQKR